MSQPLISVIIPCYNYGHLISRATASVFAQKIDEVEVLIIDDGSTDDSKLVIPQLQKKYPELRAIHQKNAGLAAVRNRGVEETVGRFLVFLDADDEFDTGALKAVGDAIRQEPDAQVIIGGHTSVSDSGRERYHSAPAVSESGFQRFADYLNKKLTISNGSTFFHRAIFDVTRYPEDCRNSEDIPVSAHAVGLFECFSIDKSLAKVHKHDDSLRHNIEYADQVALKIVDYVFNPTIIPDNFMVIQNKYKAQRCLSVFRTFYLSGKYNRAKTYYITAISIDPKMVLKFSYLRKFIKSLFFREKV
ncbi:glycosyltransferase [Aestuariirhabdus sp. Z084]|uniref:glycosyltransferase family 2 protein n=1 Tax=Aestuariirhabdus haliotis TaxID=2918751 RepID=UPI00201B3F47|nr:glycosyltransferase family 2 protein [Aestuariirhabdus haliotis]MCL6415594.1 glycosyltransferase [Aestuariirhabdus haliotis]MCL6419589.1 glycosyltransferase [Aestuariirhabdus haliotis]